MSLVFLFLALRSMYLSMERLSLLDTGLRPSYRKAPANASCVEFSMGLGNLLMFQVFSLLSVHVAVLCVMFLVYVQPFHLSTS